MIPGRAATDEDEDAALTLIARYADKPGRFPPRTKTSASGPAHPSSRHFALPVPERGPSALYNACHGLDGSFMSLLPVASRAEDEVNRNHDDDRF